MLQGVDNLMFQGVDNLMFVILFDLIFPLKRILGPIQGRSEHWAGAHGG
jgi:hypothetical protein